MATHSILALYYFKLVHFYRTMLSIAWTMLPRDVCPSVCLSESQPQVHWSIFWVLSSETCRYYVEMAKCVVRLFLPSSFFHTERYGNIQTGTPSIKKIVIFDQCRNDTRYRVWGSAVSIPSEVWGRVPTKSAVKYILSSETCLMATILVVLCKPKWCNCQSESILYTFQVAGAPHLGPACAQQAPVCSTANK